MRNGSRYPHCSKRWHNPNSRPSRDSHYTLGGIDELVTIVEMKWDDVPCGVILRERCNIGSLVAQAVEERGLSLLRHSLSQ